MLREVVVLGAGMVGVSVAWHLARRGHAVTLVDRRPPGCETSSGNAGLIQREAVRPRPFPRDAATLWRLLPNHGIDVRYRGAALFGAARALAGYWHNSAPKAFARIVPEYASLIRHCTDEHAVMIEHAGADALVRKDGWRYGFRSQSVFDHQLELAQEAHDRFGADFRMLDQAGLQQSEPALSDRLIGAIEWTNSWSVVDPGALVQAYAAAFASLGGRVVQAEAGALTQVGGAWQLATDRGAFSGSDLVLAAGPWSSEWLARLGYRLPMFYMRGYHMHYAALDGQVLNKPVLDYEKGYLLAPKRAGIRLTTGAELNSLHAPPLPGQLQAAEHEARQIFPLGERLDPSAWLGARPCMADMKPVIGPAPRHNGLWFALGHAHQGFTSGPLTGRLIGEMMDGEKPLVDMAPFRADRF